MANGCQKVLELGISACILGIGVWGALLSNSQVRTKLGPEATPPVAIAGILIELIIVGASFHLRDNKELFQ